MGNHPFLQPPTSWARGRAWGQTTVATGEPHNDEFQPTSGLPVYSSEATGLAHGEGRLPFLGQGASQNKAGDRPCTGSC